MKEWLSIMRIRQYIKNVFVLAPAFFGGGMMDVHTVAMSLGAFCCFCLAASGIYIVNDFFDIAEDRQHPLKRLRPLASGSIGSTSALVISAILGTASIFGSALLSIDFTFIITGYILLNILYSWKLKHIALLDLNIIAIGFVLRVLAGAAVSGIVPSGWILLMTYLTAMFLAISKRRTDVVLATSGNKVRKNINGYGIPFIDTVMGILATTLLICYIMYCLSHDNELQSGSSLIYLSIVFVANGIFRYLKLAQVDGSTYSPTEILFRDTFLKVTVGCWTLLFVYILYSNP